jgi:hypothetical protein
MRSGNTEQVLKKERSSIGKVLKKNRSIMRQFRPTRNKSMNIASKFTMSSSVEAKTRRSNLQASLDLCQLSDFTDEKQFLK